MITTTKNIPPNTPPRISPVLLFPSFVVNPPTHESSYVCTYVFA